MRATSAVTGDGYAGVPVARPEGGAGVPAGDAAALARAVHRVATTRPQTAQIYEAAAAAARDLLAAPGVLVGIAKGEALICAGVAGETGMPLGAALPLTHSIAATVLRTRTPTLCQDGRHDPRTDPDHVAAHGVRSSAVVPLLYRDKALGIISAVSPRPATFDDADLSLLHVLADVVAARLAYALALDEQAEVQARLDDQGTLLSAVVDGLSEGVVVHGLDGLIVTANPAAEAILDTPLDRLRGSTMLSQDFTLVGEDGAPIPDDRRPVPTALRTGTRQPPVVLGVAHRDGRTTWLTVTSVPIHDGDSGAVTGVVSSFRDITTERAALADLDSTRRRLVAAQQLTGLATWDADVVTGRLTWSEQMYRLVGVSRDDSAPPTLESFLSVVHPDDRDDCRRLAQQALRTGQGYQQVYRVRLDDGEVRHLLSWADVVRDRAGTMVALRGATVDVSERVRATALATQSEERFRIAFENAPIGMTIISLRPENLGQVLRANETFCGMLDRPHGGIRGLTVVELTAPSDQPADRERLRLLSTGEATRLSFEKRYLRADGEHVPTWVTTSVTTDAEGVPLYVISHCLDLTERLRTQADLERLALTDTLTGLANRALLGDRLDGALARLQRHPGILAVLMIDLDRFKLVNDTLGHHAGDALLVEVADRLRRINRADATIARPGGDEFVILVEGLDDASGVQALAKRMLAALREPYSLAGAGDAIVCTASIGVTLATDPDRRPDDLLREADLALYRAKDSGRDQWALFDDVLRARAVARVDIERRLRRAVLDDGLRLVFQPVLDLRNDRWNAPEVLLRIDDPQLGELAPGAFIEVAEDTGLIVDIDHRVLRAALQQFASWGALHPLGVGGISVNVSARSIEQPGFADDVVALLADAGVDGSALRLEVTERTLLAAGSTAVDALTRLTGLGVGFGIDDFGTGYSALAYLQKFPLRFLKIDQSFTSRLGRSRRDDALVSAIIALGHAQDLTVVAEGVERPEQLAALRAAGCDLAQGYLLGRPMTSTAFADHVRRGAPISSARSSATSTTARRTRPALPARRSR